MTSRDLVVSVEEGDAHRFSSMSEGYVYLYLRHHADKKGIFRLAMTELAAMLNVNRQTILKHVDTLMEKQLVTKQGHGRYRIHTDPWSFRDIVSAYLNTLDEGQEFDPSALFQAAYAEKPDWSSDDPRVDEVLTYANKLEQAGWLQHDPMTSTYTKLKRRHAVAH